MNYNYHTHTCRCGHASGSDEEYINFAIEAGIKYLGFSDHAPFIFPDGYEADWRVPLSGAQEYVNSISALREKYRDRIEIKIGFEMEYYGEHFEKMLNIARNCGAEYLILAQHFILNEHPDGKGSVGPTDSEEHLKTYVDEVISGMESGFFSYVAHPDMFNFVGDSSLFRREAERLCVESKALNIPLELNLLGIRGKRNYPSDAFWAVAGGVGCPVTMGCDAHSPDALYNADAIKTARHLIEKHKLNYIAKPTLIPLK